MKFARFVAVVVAAAVLGACGGGSGAVPGTGAGTGLNPTAAELGLWPRPGPSKRACGDVPAGRMRCFALIRTDIAGMKHEATPSGYGPSDLQTAYSLTSFSKNNGTGITVAIVDAFDDPNAASDLAVYRAQYGLPACGPSNGCFTKVQFGSQTDTGWATEESLDVDMVSAICPNCKILLVEAATNTGGSLTKAERYATAHANYVSNSWGGGEGGTSRLDKSYKVAGVAITAATGDSGYNKTAQWPAILPSVVGAGGTSLISTNPRQETAWIGAGSGCSKIYKTPLYQQGTSTGCTMRAQADTSADADPYTGVAVYDTFNESGWLVFGGTSVASPIIASVYALAGNISTNGPATLYHHASSLNDIVAGSNGTCGAPLCVAGPGWDGPTGLGTPNGIAAF